MKKKRIIRIIIALLMLIPFTVVNAATKTEELVEKLKEQVKDFDGKVNYANDNIEIEWNIPNSKSNEVSFSYDGNIIEYNPGEITTYEEAEKVSNSVYYAVYLIQSALRVNGFSEKEIEDFFGNNENSFNYEKNGFEIKQFGDAKKFTSQTGDATITITPVSVKIDVTRANINKESDEIFKPKSTTIEDIINDLQSDNNFTTTEYEGKVVYENEITNDDNTITIYHTYHWEDYYNVSFQSEDDIITYKDEEINSYADAESALSHQMFLSQILTNALQMNGYTNKQIEDFFANENNELNYELNGIEIKELGDEKQFTSSDGFSKLHVTPMSIKIDLKRANINIENGDEEIETITEYHVLEGANQTINNEQELTFKFDIEYSKFIENGNVYIDGELVNKENYTSKEGSTIITFNNDYVKKLSLKEHTLKIKVENNEVETKFTIEKKINNPQTGDNLIFYISILGLSIIGLTTALLFKKKKIN